MKHDVKPGRGDLAEAIGLVEPALETCEQDLPAEAPITVSLGWTTDQRVISELGGASGACFGPADIEIAFNTTGESWQNAIQAMTARQYAHSWIRSKLPDDTVSFWWQYLLCDAAASLLSERYFDAPFPW
ncbi:MAG: hypothetical protein ABEI52_03860, partial [Halobacteriaceae archaeon]